VKKKRLSRKERETQRKYTLCGFAPLRLCVNKKKNVSPQCSGTGSKEGEPQRKYPFAAWLLCESLIKKTLPKKDSLSQAVLFFFRAKAQRRKEIY